MKQEKGMHSKVRGVKWWSQIVNCQVEQFKKFKVGLSQKKKKALMCLYFEISILVGVLMCHTLQTSQISHAR